MDIELKIPQDDFESLIELLNTSEDEFNALVEDIEGIDSNLKLDEIEKKLQEITSNYKLIFGLYFTFCKFDVAEEKFAKQLSEYYHSQIESETEGGIDTQNRILRLLKKENPLRLAIKSLILQQEVSNAYIDSRIITDIRPVFSSKEEKTIIGSVVTNNLKISYSNNDQKMDFFVSLDEEDLNLLKKTIERAIDKTKVLKSKKI